MTEVARTLRDDWQTAARTIIRSRWLAVQRVAEGLLEHDRLDARRVRELVDAPLQSEDEPALEAPGRWGCSLAKTLRSPIAKSEEQRNDALTSANTARGSLGLRFSEKSEPWIDKLIVNCDDIDRDRDYWRQITPLSIVGQQSGALHHALEILRRRPPHKEVQSW